MLVPALLPAASAAWVVAGDGGPELAAGGAFVLGSCVEVALSAGAGSLRKGSLSWIRT